MCYNKESDGGQKFNKKSFGENMQRSEKIKNENVRKVGIAVGLTIAYIVLAIIIRPVYYMNDDVTIRSILSGALTGTPNGHAVYMAYPLTGLLALLERIIPVVPWLDVFFSGVILLCLYLLVTASKKFSVPVCILCFLASLGIFWDTIWYMHYTIVSAIAAGTAIALWVVKDKKDSSVVLLVLSFLIRKQVFLLCLPFFGLAVVYVLFFKKDVFSDGEEDGKKDRYQNFNIIKKLFDSPSKKVVFGTVSAILSLAVTVLIFAVINKCFYLSSDWKEYTAYNEVRTELYDYTGFTSMNADNPALKSIDISESDKQILISYDTMLDKNLGIETIIKVVDAMPDETPSFKEAAKQYLIKMRYDKYPLRTALFFMYPIAVMALCFKKKWKGIPFVLCLAGGRTLVWIYLIRQGRFPERIYFSLSILELMFLLGVILRTFKYKEKNKWIERFFKFILIAAGTAFLVINVLFTSSRLENAHKNQDSYNELKTYFAENREKEFLLDVYPMVMYGESLYSKSPSNIMLLGGWLTKSPVSETVFESYCAEDGGEALVSGKDVYFVTYEDKDVEWFSDYLCSRFGECKLNLEDSIHCQNDKTYAVYRISFS